MSEEKGRQISGPSRAGAAHLSSESVTHPEEGAADAGAKFGRDAARHHVRPALARLVVDRVVGCIQRRALRQCVSIAEHAGTRTLFVSISVEFTVGDE